MAMLIPFILLSLSWAPRTLEAEEAFLQGNTLYLKGELEPALRFYEKALNQGGNPGLLFYNEGCCLFRLGRYGEALYHFFSARHFLPRDAENNHNIRVTQKRLGFEKSPGGSLEHWILKGIQAFTLAEYGAASAFSLALAFLLQAFCFLKPKRMARKLVKLFLGFTLVFFLLGIVEYTLAQQPWGVAFRACEVLSEPSPATGEQLFTLREGERVRLEESRPGWHYVENGTGRRGWVRDREVCPVPKATSSTPGF